MFKQELIEELRARGYAPRAWADYVRGHVRLAYRTFEERPAAVRSVIASGVVLFILAFALSLALSLWRADDLGRRVFLGSALWLAFHGLWILLHLGLLVDLAGRPVLRLGLPNGLTLFRGATIPPLVILAGTGEMGLACAVFVAGGLSDVADGVVARRLGPVTRLGVVMDPVVDIAWNGAAVLALTRAGVLPGWALALVGVRYGLVLAGSAGLYFIHATLRIRPTRFGKASGAVMASAFLLVMLNRLFVPAAAAAAVEDLLELGIGFLLWGTIAYVIALGILNFRQPERAREPLGRVVGRIQR